MKRLFPCYEDYLKTTDTVSEIIRRIEEILMSNNKFILLSDNHYNKKKIVFIIKNESYLCYNSFAPIVNIEIQEGKDETIVVMLFELRKSVKIILITYWIFMLLIQVIILLSLLMKQLSGNVALLMPIGMAFYAYVFCAVGLKSSAKKTFKMLLKELKVVEK